MTFAVLLVGILGGALAVRSIVRSRQRHVEAMRHLSEISARLRRQGIL